jgi:glycosyltransferase involved in cell wall biosynthesis
VSVGKRRILHIFSTFDPGGPQLRQARLIGMLPAHWSHEILAMDGRVGAQAHLPEDRNCSFVAAPSAKGLLALGSLGRFLAARQADLIISYNWGAFDMLAAARIKGLHPLCHVVDGFRPDEALQQIGRRRIARRLLYPRVDAVVVISEQLQILAARSWRVPASKLHLIPNGVDLARFASASDGEVRSQARSRWNLPSNALLLGAVGGLRPVKDHATLIQAFALLDAPAHCLLVLAGDGPLRTDLEAQCAELGLADRVRFLGHVADTSSLYPALDLLLFSSQSEQMPITALEAMASSLPVVATRVGDLPRMLPKASVELLAPAKNPQALANLIQPFLDSPDLRRTTGQANLTHCRKTYSEESMVDSWHKVLAGLLND